MKGNSRKCNYTLSMYIDTLSILSVFIPRNDKKKIITSLRRACISA